ncbi:MAG TPA: hypothetical protein VFG49_01415 [Dyella sp.]|uniref:hypothetical protein n=1 Tax=Dyella sp. TaxID=1869338 RepID=UPI002D790474|nr:hypothetical protein [Dyella sp.]HET6552170.1 hypothetical protein [Dyella sp.]
MSFLNRVDLLYGNLIRLLTALLTVALLALAVMACFNWQRLTAMEEVDTSTQPQTPPKIATEDVVKHTVASQTDSVPDPIGANDPHRAAYDRIGKALETFARKHDICADEFQAESLLSTIHANVDFQDTDALKAAYANGLADTFERALSDPRIEALLPRPADQKEERSFGYPDARGVVVDMINQYDTLFSQSLAATSATHGYLDKKDRQDAAWRSLARIGGPMLLLVVVLQLLTFGRIEQNTRRLDSPRA